MMYSGNRGLFDASLILSSLNSCFFFRLPLLVFADHRQPLAVLVALEIGFHAGPSETISFRGLTRLKMPAPE
jgi:hypothetical protein